MKKKYLILMICSLLFAFFLSSHCYAQTRITGKVLDAESKLPIELVHIAESNNQRAVITNMKGEFNIEIDSFPVILFVSHIGYKTSSILLEKSLYSTLIINLQADEQKINEVVIVADRVQYFFKEESFDVINYEFGDGFIWIVGYPDKDRRKPQLRIIGLGGDTKSKMELPKQGKLFRDAFGNVHLIARDSLYQLYNLEDSVVLLYASARNGSEEALFDLQLMVDSLAIIKEPREKGFLKNYYLYNLRDSTRTIFYQAYDREVFLSSSQSANFKHASIPDIIFPPFMPSKGSRALPTWDPATAFMHNVQDRLLNYGPVNCKFFRFEDDLIVIQDKGPLFWSYNGNLELKSSGRIAIPDKSFNIDMIQDPLSEKVFVVHERLGQRFITLIDAHTGDVGEIMKLGDFAFVENIKVYGNRVYFTRHGKTTEQNMNLYSVVFENNYSFPDPNDNSPLETTLVKPAVDWFLRK